MGGIQNSDLTGEQLREQVSLDHRASAVDALKLVTAERMGDAEKALMFQCAQVHATLALVDAITAIKFPVLDIEKTGGKFDPHFRIRSIGGSR